MTSFLIKIFGISLLFSPNIEIQNNIELSILPPPQMTINEKSLEVSAKAYVIYDLKSENVLMEKNAHTRLPMASLTKLMTALIIIEENSPKEIVKISKEASVIEPVKIWLLENEQITVENLAKALLIPSANDSAIALAIFNSGSKSSFVEKMNKRAELLGLKNTHFQNPHGLDAENHYSSSYDLALLSKFLIKNSFKNWGSFFVNTIKIKNSSVASINGKITHALENSNELLWSDLPIYGVKTGTTDEARECLITYFNNNKKQFLIVILGSKDRYGDTKKIINHIL